MLSVAQMMRDGLQAKQRAKRDMEDSNPNANADVDYPTSSVEEPTDQVHTAKYLHMHLIVLRDIEHRGKVLNHLDETTSE